MLQSVPTKSVVEAGRTDLQKVRMGSQLDKPRLFLAATGTVHVNIAVIINAILLYMYCLIK